MWKFFSLTGMARDKNLSLVRQLFHTIIERGCYEHFSNW